VLTPLSFSELALVNLVGEFQWGVVISFDGEWAPFLGHTKGYNSPSKPPRLPIRRRSEVLEVAAAWLMKCGRDVAGGRVFINAKGVICEGASIGHWSWMGTDPVETVLDICRGLLQRDITIRGLTTG
jgi:hypothetical protein